MAKVPDEMWAMIDRMRTVVRDVWAEAYWQGVADERQSQDFDGGMTQPNRVNPYEGKESLAKVFEFLSPDSPDEREVGEGSS